MAKISSRLLFLTTSPRTPEKMISEVELLIRNFNGRKWNKEIQCEFMKLLREEQFFNGHGANDPALSARDRINRAPKSLGFVTISPNIRLTQAGDALLKSKRKEEIFLRQMLKFQLPSPFHIPTADATHFCVKPYLEMLRLIRTMGTLKFDELQIFGMQLTDWHIFDEIVQKIEQFRIAKTKNSTNYRTFKTDYQNRQLREIYSQRICQGNTKTRESNDKSISKFLKTQSQNMRDYADACFRYLRSTGLVNVSHIGKSLSIIPERIADVDYILSTIDREPCFIDNESAYIEYLGNATIPKLLTDNNDQLINRITKDFPEYFIPNNATTQNLKDILSELYEKRKLNTLSEQVRAIKDYRLYDDIQNTYKQIANKELYDIPLMLEWNTWRAMTMLNGGTIKANLNFDDFGNPISTAAGNMADIVCDYDNFILTVEVTTSTGQKQYEMEGEPVSRHLGKIKTTASKPCYCLFVAPKINDACIAHFYTLYRANISFYGGKSEIVPLPINIFQKMLEDSYRVNYIPDSTCVQNFFEKSKTLALTCNDEKEWFMKIQQTALNWLNLNSENK